MIELNKTQMSFDGVSLLEDITFRIGQGERVSLVGPGGSGKSTILKLILGLLPADAGEIRVMETDIRGISDREKRGVLSKIGVAFQQGALFDFMTVRQNLLFAMQNMTDFSTERMETTVTKLLQGVKLGRTPNMFPYELSGGMQRRVGIARALCTEPVLSIFDEPTSGLDPVTSTIILNMIHELAGGDDPERTQLVVTSNVEIGIRFADRLIVINEGRVVADGPWRELLVDGPDWVKHFLGVRFIGLDRDYADELDLPEKFVQQHWS